MANTSQGYLDPIWITQSIERCVQSGHLKRNCPKGGAGPTNCSKDDANNVSLTSVGGEYDDIV